MPVETWKRCRLGTVSPNDVLNSIHAQVLDARCMAIQLTMSRLVVEVYRKLWEIGKGCLYFSQVCVCSYVGNADLSKWMFSNCFTNYFIIRSVLNSLCLFMCPHWHDAICTISVMYPAGGFRHSRHHFDMSTLLQLTIWHSILQFEFPLYIFFLINSEKMLGRNWTVDVMWHVCVSGSRIVVSCLFLRMFCS